MDKTKNLSVSSGKSHMENPNSNKPLKHLLETLKNISVSDILKLQTELKRAHGSRWLGPVVSRHLFPNILSNTPGKSSGEGNHLLDDRKPEKTLFANVDLLVSMAEGTVAKHTCDSCSWLATSRERLKNIVNSTYANQHWSIVEVLRYIYPDLDKELRTNEQTQRANQTSDSAKQHVKLNEVSQSFLIELKISDIYRYTDR